MILRGVFILSMSWLCVAAAGADDSPIYINESAVGPEHTINEELNLRIKGLIGANHYVVKNRLGKPVRHPDDLKSGGVNESEFSIGTVKPGLLVKITVQRNDDGLKLQLTDESAGRSKSLSRSFTIPWKKASEKNIGELLKSVDAYSDQAEIEVTAKIEDLNGGAPPNLQEMSHLALLIGLKRFQPKDTDRIGALDFYNLLNYLFKRLDSVEG